VDGAQEIERAADHIEAPAPASRAVPLASSPSVARDETDWASAFAREIDDLFLRRLRVAAGVFLALHAASFAVFASPDGSSLGAAVRLAIIPLTALLFGATFWAPARHLGRELSALMIACIAGYAAWTNASSGDALDVRALTLTIVAAGLLFPFGPRAMAALSAIVIGFYCLAARTAPGASVPVIAGDAFFVVGASTLATIASLLSSRLRAREFRARQETESLLKNMLPEPIVARLKEHRGAVADRHDEATVMFADIVGFTTMSSEIAPEALVQFLNELFSRLDALTTKHGLEKIKTIGDAYMVASGLPAARRDHAEAAALFALEVRDLVASVKTPNDRPLDVRIGIHSGPVVAGVIGATKLTYDLWGDTVNTASRMESHGEPGTIQVSEPTYEILRNRFRFESRGTIQVKGKGAMRAFALLGPADVDQEPRSRR
jgi:class 3 adenylate cyclase